MTTMWNYRQCEPSAPEAGGVLLGRYISDSADIVIDAVTVPQDGDLQARSRFFRARKRHQALIDGAWNESNGTVTYLGEWHTHPESVPHPSWVDRADWLRKGMFDVFTEAILFIIVGTEELGVWEGRHRHPTHTQLRAVGEAEARE
jgi:integrative and conjugative element protein (TIGR02256 family)